MTLLRLVILCHIRSRRLVVLTVGVVNASIIIATRLITTYTRGIRPKTQTTNISPTHKTHIMNGQNMQMPETMLGRAHRLMS